ncbi:hypothetical protein COY95_00365, partial [Candidatus Woesearchaeota archaeon CG_4_10_14_0_8_um_filter_47_5]
MTDATQTTIMPPYNGTPLPEEVVRNIYSWKKQAGIVDAYGASGAAAAGLAAVLAPTGIGTP